LESKPVSPSALLLHGVVLKEGGTGETGQPGLGEELLDGFVVVAELPAVHSSKMKTMRLSRSGSSMSLYVDCPLFARCLLRLLFSSSARPSFWMDDLCRRSRLRAGDQRALGMLACGLLAKRFSILSEVAYQLAAVPRKTYSAERAVASPNEDEVGAVDFGKRHDYTAIAVLEKTRWITGRPDRVHFARNVEIRYAVRHLERFPLGTAYFDIGARIGQLVRGLGDESCEIVVDSTGVGEAAVEIVKKKQLKPIVHGVTITGGDQSTSQGYIHRVPKRDVLMKIVLQFENQALTIASKLELAPALQHELASLTVKFSAAANDTITTWREGDHDDLVFAVALANWRAQAIRWNTTYGPTQGRLF